MELGRSYRVPYLRPFPIWRYGPRYVELGSARTEDGWYPDRFGYWEFDTLEEAQAAHAKAAQA